MNKALIISTALVAALSMGVAANAQTAPGGTTNGAPGGGTGPTTGTPNGTNGNGTTDTNGTTNTNGTTDTNGNGAGGNGMNGNGGGGNGTNGNVGTLNSDPSWLNKFDRCRPGGTSNAFCGGGQARRTSQPPKP